MVKQCCATDGVEPHYIKEEILPEFFKQFWTHRMALDRRNYKQVSCCIIAAIFHRFDFVSKQVIFGAQFPSLICYCFSSTNGFGIFNKMSTYAEGY